MVWTDTQEEDEWIHGQNARLTRKCKCQCNVNVSVSGRELHCREKLSLERGCFSGPLTCLSQKKPNSSDFIPTISNVKCVFFIHSWWKISCVWGHFRLCGFQIARRRKKSLYFSNKSAQKQNKTKSSSESVGGTSRRHPPGSSCNTSCRSPPLRPPTEEMRSSS